MWPRAVNKVGRVIYIAFNWAQRRVLLFSNQSMVLLMKPLEIMRHGRQGPTHTCMISQRARFMGPTWGPPGSCRPQVGPMLALWLMLSGLTWLVSAKVPYSYVTRASVTMSLVWFSRNIPFFRTKGMNTLRPEQNDRRFADDNFYEFYWKDTSLVQI